MASIIKQLRQAGELLNLDCGDNSCYFACGLSGMRTNGGCQCDLPGRISAMLSEQDMRLQLFRDLVAKVRDEGGEIYPSDVLWALNCDVVTGEL